jgi:hypothetical protein
MSRSRDCTTDDSDSDFNVVEDSRRGERTTGLEEGWDIHSVGGAHSQLFNSYKRDVELSLLWTDARQLIYIQA